MQHCMNKDMPTETLGTQVFTSISTSPSIAPRALGPIEHVEVGITILAASACVSVLS